MSNSLKTLRHEFKYIISYADFLKLKSKLSQILSIDRGDSYIVRSLYFDSLNDSDYYDKLNGEMVRKKIRLRLYDINDQNVKLEIKGKYDIHQLKESLIVSRNVAKEFINGNYEGLLKMEDPLALRLYSIFREGYRPKVIIEYDRLAFLTNSTTRITFDYNIKKSDDFDYFFTNDINYIDLVNANDVILEVKFDKSLEPYLSDILSKYETRFQSVSKYVMGRNL